MSVKSCFEVRKAHPEDAVGVKSVEISCGLEPWREFDYAEECERTDSQFFVATDGGRVIGFLLARRTGPNETSVFNIAVLNEYRRHRIGTFLMSELDPSDDVFLEVRESNRCAQDFYMRCGFVSVGIRKHFYRDPVENAVLMRRDGDRDAS